MINVKVKGNFNKIEKFLAKNSDQDFSSLFEHYGNQGVSKLSEATPVRTGKTSKSWSYRVKNERDKVGLTFYNSNLTEWDVPVPIVLKNGHATRRGGYVPPNDFITPVMDEVVKSTADDIWKEVTK